VNIDTLNIVVEFTDSVNTESVKRLMDQLIKDNPNAPTIYLILDNASYYHSKEVEEYRKNLGKIKFIFLPPYSPNLNLRKRLAENFHINKKTKKI
jgi:transposase